MRRYLTISLVLTAALFLATPGVALEKMSVRALDDSRGEWNNATTVTLAYYNYCTGWIWIWGGWSPGDLTGECFDVCPNGGLISNMLRTRTAAPSGYGFTGTMSIMSADANCCPTGVVASQPWLPLDGWNLYTWNVPIPPKIIVMLQWAAPSGFTALSRLGSDHPAPGPTGPAACGMCYPTTRVVHSYYYGVAGATLCPGSVNNDGVCDIEWLIDLQLKCSIGVEENTWGSIKNIYR